MANITILMPVYNTEKYLHDSIGSVLNQTYSDWELICVDDGSSDNSWNILLEYQQKDTRIKCFRQENAGPMHARYTGMQHAHGSYFIYLDSDDMYSSNLLEKTYQKAIETGADSVAPEYWYEKTEDSNIYISFNQENKVNKSEILTGIEAFSETFPWRKIHCFNLWSERVFRKSVIMENIGDNNFNADEYIQRVLLLNCNKIVFSDGQYLRRYNPTSITHVLKRRNFNRLDANEKLINLALDYNVDKPILDKVYGFAFIQLKELMLALKAKNDLSDEDKKWAYAQLKSAYKSYVVHDLDLSYKKLGRLKTMIQIHNYSIFSFITFLQVKRR
jgi:glycosyltransferase involved in cell wall biosynthesis